VAEAGAGCITDAEGVVVGREEAWHRFAVEPGTDVVMRGVMTGPAGAADNTIVARLRFIDGDGQDVDVPVNGLAHSARAGQFFYPQRCSHNGRFEFFFAVPAAVTTVLVSFQHWRASEPAGFRISQASLRPVVEPAVKVSRPQSTGTVVKEPAGAVTAGSAKPKRNKKLIPLKVPVEGEAEPETADAGPAKPAKERPKAKSAGKADKGADCPAEPAAATLAKKTAAIDKVSEAQPAARKEAAAGAEASGPSAKPATKTKAAAKSVAELEDVASAFAKTHTNELLKIGLGALYVGDAPFSEALAEEYIRKTSNATLATRLARRRLLGGRSTDAVALAPYTDDAFIEREKGRLALLKYSEQYSQSRRSKVALKTKGVLYLLHNAQPVDSGGYATRAHGLLQGYQKAGWTVIPVARPGYPEDRGKSNGGRTEAEVGGINYRYLPCDLSIDQADQIDYINRYAEMVLATVPKEEIGVVQAASFFQNAFAGRLIADRLGVPLVYEMRGLEWFTRGSIAARWQETEQGQLLRTLEVRAAHAADHVFAITRALKSWLIEEGVPEEKISLLPNGCAVDRFQPLQRDEDFARELGLSKSFVVGYMGSVVFYERVDFIAQAVKAARAKSGLDIRFLLVGDGPVYNQVMTSIRRMGGEEFVVAPGRVPHSEIPRYYSLVDALTLARKDLPVCQVISPLKPLEAMAMAKPVITSDVAAIVEMIDASGGGLIYPSNDVEAFADAIIEIAASPERRKELADKAYKWAVEKRDWQYLAQEAGAEIIRQFPPAKPKPAKKPAGGKQKQLAQLLADGDEAGFRNMVLEALTGADKKAGANTALLAARAAKGQTKLELWVLRQRAEHLPSVAAFQQWAELAYRRKHYGEVEEALDKLAKEDSSILKTIPSLGTMAEQSRKAAVLSQALREAARPRPYERAGSGRPDVAYLAYNSLPYASGGYATRTHGLCVATRGAGADLSVYARPGFPSDRDETIDASTVTNQTIDRVEYVFSSAADIRVPSFPYFIDSAAYYEEVARDKSIIHAASNYFIAMPGLIAARRARRRFIYEVRGFWEITKISRQGYDETNFDKFRSAQESLPALLADHVITLTPQMTNELIERGVNPDRITVIPNSVDTNRFVPRERDRALARRLGIADTDLVIGYIGTFVDYEGLDDLLEVFHQLTLARDNLKLLLVGDDRPSGVGEETVLPGLKKRCAELGLNDKVIFTGRVPNSEVPGLYSLVDIAPFPRKPWLVCEMVSPMKPLEAMSLQKAVVVSSVGGIAGMVRNGETALAFEKGSNAAFYSALEQLCDNPDLRARLGAAARPWVEANRSWRAAGNTLMSLYESMLERTAPPPVDQAQYERLMKEIFPYDALGRSEGR